MSVEVNITIDGVEELETALQRLDSALRERVHRQLASWATSVKASAEQNVPVRTGHLRSSIYARIQDWSVEIGAEATYALCVEFGTRYARARPFLFPAIQSHLPMLEQIICEAVDAAKVEVGF